MKEDLLKHLLESVLGPSKSSRGARGEQSAVFTCPSCNHRKKKLTVNLVTQQFQCWVCNFKGHRAFKLLKEAKANPKAYDTLKSIDSEYKFKKSKQPKPDPTSLQLPKEIEPIISSSAVLSRHALHYLKGRGVTEQDIVKYNIHYSETGDLKNGFEHELKREIIAIATDKKHLTYLECKHQFMLGVLESSEYLNDNILGKFFDKDFV